MDDGYVYEYYTICSHKRDIKPPKHFNIINRSSNTARTIRHDVYTVIKNTLPF